MAAWQVQDAKQRFSEVLRKAGTEGDQIITRHGAEVAAVIDFGEYRRLRELDARDQAELGLFPELHDDDYAAELDGIVADRSKARPRRAVEF